MGRYQQWAPYVPVAVRRAQAAREMEKLDKKSNGKPRSPVRIAGREMTTTFWGNAWCENLENYSDYSNRLPRGRSYARNGSILDLQIDKGVVTAMVSGSSLYRINIKIQTLKDNLWKNIKVDCAQSIHSVMDLLQGKLSNAVMQRLTQEKTGLFPHSKEIDLKCSCPDGAYLCKHLAAVMYGIGHRLDTMPELLFTLRGVSQHELIGEIATTQTVSDALTGASRSAEDGSDILSDDLGDIFGIDLVSASPKSIDKPKARKVKPTASKTAKKKRSGETIMTEPIADQPRVKKPATKKISKAKAKPGTGKTRSKPKSVRTAMPKAKRSTKPIKASPTRSAAAAIAKKIDKVGSPRGLSPSLRLALEQHPQKKSKSGTA